MTSRRRVVLSCSVMALVILLSARLDYCCKLYEWSSPNYIVEAAESYVAHGWVVDVCLAMVLSIVVALRLLVCRGHELAREGDSVVVAMRRRRSHAVASACPTVAHVVHVHG